MGLIDKVKHAIAGSAAKVEVLKATGDVKPGALVFVRVAVTAQVALKSKGVFVDLHGEDDLEENLLDKAAEIFNPDPEYSWPLASDVELAAGKTEVFENAISLPAGLDMARTWLLRARLETTGRDPASPWAPLGEPPAPKA